MDVERTVINDTARQEILRAVHVRWLLAVIFTVVALGGFLVVVHFATDVDVNLFLADPAEKAFLPFYTGSYTYIGAFALLSILTVCLFTASLMRRDVDVPVTRMFLVTLGVLAAWLGLDDLFMFHEWAGLVMAELAGQDDIAAARSRLEGVVFVAYGIAWLGWAAWFRKSIRVTRYVLIVLAFAGLAMSAAVDVGMFLFPSLIPDTAWMPTTLSVMEEMFKLTGIFFLLAYGVDTCRKALVSSPVLRDASSQGR